MQGKAYYVPLVPHFLHSDTYIIITIRISRQSYDEQGSLAKVFACPLHFLSYILFLFTWFFAALFVWNVSSWARQGEKYVANKFIAIPLCLFGYLSLGEVWVMEKKPSKRCPPFFTLYSLVQQPLTHFRKKRRKQ